MVKTDEVSGDLAWTTAPSSHSVSAEIFHSVPILQLQASIDRSLSLEVNWALGKAATSLRCVQYVKTKYLTTTDLNRVPQQRRHLNFVRFHCPQSG